MSRPSPVLDAKAPGMTLAEWAALSEDEPGELVDGCLVEEEAADLLHESTVSWLIGVLRGWLIARGGFVFGSEAKFEVSEARGRKPDVSFYLPGAQLARRGVDVRTRFRWTLRTRTGRGGWRFDRRTGL